MVIFEAESKISLVIFSLSNFSNFFDIWQLLVGLGCFSGMGNLSYFVHSVSFRGFVFRGFGFVTSDDLN